MIIKSSMPSGYLVVGSTAIIPGGGTVKRSSSKQVTLSAGDYKSLSRALTALGFRPVPQVVLRDMTKNKGMSYHLRLRKDGDWELTVYDEVRQCIVDMAAIGPSSNIKAI